MKKFITALAATFATAVIGSAASAATPTFNVYHEEVLPALGEANAPSTFSVYHEEILPALVAANTPPTFNVVREEILPALVATVADYNWDAIPTSERITPVTVASYNWEALPESERVPTSAVVVYNFDALPAAERFVADADLFSVHIVGGLGPQLPYDPMRGVDYGFVQALKQLNADPFAEQIVGGLGPQPFNAVTYSEVFVGGQLHIIPATDAETFILAGN